MESNDFWIGLTIGSNFQSYQRLCSFARAMQSGQYVQILDSDIDKGVDYENARCKLTMKLFKQLEPRIDMTGIDEAIDAYCNAWKRRFKDYNANHGQ